MNRDVQKPGLYKAQCLCTGQEAIGYYFEMPATTYCFEEDYKDNPVPIRHYLVGCRMTDWGLPNEPVLYEIDVNTLAYYTPSGNKGGDYGG